MAAYNKFNNFIDYVFQGKVNLKTDTVKCLLTNTMPTSTQTKYSDISGTELAAGNGYTTGGSVAPGQQLTNNAGTESFTVQPITFTSSTGNMGPFRYVVFYDATATDQPLICFFDYGQVITLNGAAGETFAVAPATALFQAA